MRWWVNLLISLVVLFITESLIIALVVFVILSIVNEYGNRLKELERNTYKKPSKKDLNEKKKCPYCKKKYILNSDAKDEYEINYYVDLICPYCNKKQRIGKLKK